MNTVIVSGPIANKPFNGGAAWTRLSYVLGLRRLGFDVYFIEQIDPEACFDEFGARADFESSINLRYFQRIVEQHAFVGRAALIEAGSHRTYGLSLAAVSEVAESAALLLNISGHLSLAPLKRCIRLQAYLDLDPGFTQFWHAAGNGGSRLAGHHLYFTVGENIGTPYCSVPTGDVRWRPTVPPVVLDQWPVSETGPESSFTTIASWRGPYGPVVHQDQTFGSKVYEFRRFKSLPVESRAEFEIALDIHPGDEKDRNLLCGNGWRLADPRRVAGDPHAFRQYVQNSAAEFSVAQEIYVKTNSGWFSDRTTRYLASGKPALVQDTGFSRNYPAGDGLVPFSSMEEAIRGVRDITSKYAAHSQASRQIAETYFDSDRVLTKLIDETGICP